MVCAGAALLPDADHRRATIAHSLPPVSNAICAGIGEVSGGHRNGTHSLLGIAAFTLLAWVLGLWTMENSRFGIIYPGAGLLAVLLVSFALKALKFIPDTMAKLPWLRLRSRRAFSWRCSPPTSRTGWCWPWPWAARCTSPGTCSRSAAAT